MRYAIFSDIHANVVALRRVLAEAKVQNADAFLCLGDIVGYGPEPAAALHEVRDSFVMCVAGNHDDAVCGRASLDDFTGKAAATVERHATALSDDDKRFLATLPYVHRLSMNVVAAHGDIVDPEKFYYVENEEDAAENFNASLAQLIFVGHTHVPAIFVTGSSGKVYKMPPQDFSVEQGKRYIVNPGSVGYPREENGVCRSSFVIYDSDEKTVTYHYVPFLVESLLSISTEVPEEKMSAAPETVKIKQPILLILFKWFFYACSILALAVLLLCAIANMRVGRFNRNFIRYDKAYANGQTLESQGFAVVAEKHMRLMPRDRVVRGGLVLESKSVPVYFEIEFTLKNGKKLIVPPYMVKKNTSREFGVPLGSQSARFRLYRLSDEGEGEVLVKSFEPSGGAKSPKKKKRSQKR